MFIRTLLLLQDEENEDIFESYIKVLHICKVKPREIVLSLQSKGIILKSFHCPKEGEDFDPYSIPFNKNFIKKLYRCSFEMGKELFEAYPQFGIVNGNPTGIRSVSKKFDSLEDFYRFYGKTIKWKSDFHNHIIELVKWANENNILNTTLANFVIDHKWEELEALKKGDGANVNFDAIKLV